MGKDIRNRGLGVMGSVEKRRRREVEKEIAPI